MIRVRASVRVRVGDMVSDGNEDGEEKSTSQKKKELLAIKKRNKERKRLEKGQCQTPWSENPLTPFASPYRR